MNLPIQVIVGNRKRVFRAPHDRERVDWNAKKYDYIPNTKDPTSIGHIRSVVVERHKSMPEVYRFNPLHSVKLTEALQWLWRNINPELSGDKWATLCGSWLMLCNGGGFSDPDDPRADFVNGRHPDKPLPVFDEIRFMGGAKFQERETRNGLVYVEYIDAQNPPSAEYVLEHDYLWYWATGIRPDGGINYIWRLGIDGTDKRVRIPIIASKPIYLPESELHAIPPGSPFPEPNWQFFNN